MHTRKGKQVSSLTHPSLNSPSTPKQVNSTHPCIQLKKKIQIQQHKK